ncbi:MAG: DNA/RNA nuclease SfsA [Candidatus Thorarchaeota archaeon]
MAQNIVEGTLIERPNRFLGIVRLGSKKIEAHIPNPGRMYELMVPGKKVFIRPVHSDTRRTNYDLIAVQHEGILVSIDSILPNRFMKAMLNSHSLPMFEDYDQVQSEPRVYNGRFDFKLTGKTGITFIEVKSCTLVEDGHALFPDSPTSRGTRHLLHLCRALEEGLAQQAAVVFVVQRHDARLFSPNEETDPNFSAALRKAHECGVDIIPIATKLDNWNLRMIGTIPFDLDFFLNT